MDQWLPLAGKWAVFDGKCRGTMLGGAVFQGLVKKVAKFVEFLRRKWCDFGGRGLLVCSLKMGC